MEEIGAEMKFGTKAETLLNLKKTDISAKVLDVFLFEYKQWRSDPNSFLEEIKLLGLHNTYIVRSSSLSEDSFEASFAGSFESILNVTLSNMIDAINQVFESYDTIDDSNQILIQPMLEESEISGVLFSYEKENLSPYYFVNFQRSSDTEAVTSGVGDSETWISSHHNPNAAPEEFLQKLVQLTKELMALFQFPFLDVEFAVKKGELYLFQVRPMVVNLNEQDPLSLDSILEKLFKKYKKLNQPHPNLLGQKTLYGLMPDWNPAEIIGKRPRQLALSLYKEFVTDSVWAYQRNNYGYRNLRSHPLLISFFGIPFIDMRVDFNSFIPEELDEKIAGKLVDFYLSKLEANPRSHDKIEFDIVLSCYSLDFDAKKSELLDNGFSESECTRIEFSLLNLTNKIIRKNEGFFEKDIQRLKILENKFTEIKVSDLSTIDKIYWHIENCKRYGTLPFAGVARAAFIGVQLLNSLKESRYLSSEQQSAFLSSLFTVSSDLKFKLSQLKSGEINREEFDLIFGHLRPGTYDILSSRYDENFESYFDLSQVESDKKRPYFEWDQSVLDNISDTLRVKGIKINASELVDFIKKSIEGREWAKLVFTRSLSEVLRLISSLGQRLDIQAEDLSFLDIQSVRKLYSNLDHRDVREVFLENIQLNQELYEYTLSLELPNLITSPEMLYSFYVFEDDPNYITQKSVQGQVIYLDKNEHADVENKIVCIQNADPGYDYLFSKRIAGLVTQFGGVNSHMAIRCAELGVPAMIGSGSVHFKEISNAEIVQIDCAVKKYNVTQES